jgi:hypothetical protein
MRFVTKIYDYIFKKKDVSRLLVVQETNEGFYVEDRDGDLLLGPYKRGQDAKGVRTRLLKHG